jgi:hypothetical protein
LHSYLNLPTKTIFGFEIRKGIENETRKRKKGKTEETLN